ncbi:MAG: 4Fe-4S binding protein [Deltaproteobacteria bacterium]|nr:4Fe-4S binding protein [Deltaproteobacteria bacterium]
MGHLHYLRNVVSLQLQPEKCTGCGVCLEVCPHDVFSLGQGLVEIKDKNDCMECGACALNCPAEALSVDAGVGCAAAIIYGFLGRESDCCCVIEPKQDEGEFHIPDFRQVNQGHGS